MTYIYFPTHYLVPNNLQKREACFSRAYSHSLEWTPRVFPFETRRQWSNDYSNAKPLMSTPPRCVNGRGSIILLPPGASPARPDSLHPRPGERSEPVGDAAPGVVEDPGLPGGARALPVVLAGGGVFPEGRRRRPIVHGIRRRGRCRNYGIYGDK